MAPKWFCVLAVTTRIFMISFPNSKTSKTKQPSYKDSFLTQRNQRIIIYSNRFKTTKSHIFKTYIWDTHKKVEQIILQSVMACSHRRRGRDKSHRNWVETRQNCLVGGVNTIGDETKLSCRRCEQSIQSSKTGTGWRQPTAASSQSRRSVSVTSFRARPTPTRLKVNCRWSSRPSTWSTADGHHRRLHGLRHGTALNGIQPDTRGDGGQVQVARYKVGHYQERRRRLWRLWWAACGHTGWSTRSTVSGTCTTTVLPPTVRQEQMRPPAVACSDWTYCPVRRFVIACSHRRHGQDKTVLSCLVRVGDVNITRQFRLVSTQFLISKSSIIHSIFETGQLQIGNWVETRQNCLVVFTPPTRTRQDKTVLSCLCRRCEQATGSSDEWYYNDITRGSVWNKACDFSTQSYVDSTANKSKNKTAFQSKHSPMCVLSYSRICRFLHLWPWPWPSDLGTWSWPKYFENVPA